MRPCSPGAYRLAKSKPTHLIQCWYRLIRSSIRATDSPQSSVCETDQACPAARMFLHFCPLARGRPQRQDGARAWAAPSRARTAPRRPPDGAGPHTHEDRRPNWANPSAVIPTAPCRRPRRLAAKLNKRMLSDNVRKPAPRRLQDTPHNRSSRETCHLQRTWLQDIANADF